LVINSNGVNEVENEKINRPLSVHEIDSNKEIRSAFENIDFLISSNITLNYSIETEREFL
jgi:hypothetical protein